MPIEVKQLVVRGEIQRNTDSVGQDETPGVDLDALKDELLEACRQMLEEALRRSRER